LSDSEPEPPKPDNAVDQEVSNDLDNLKAENERLQKELAKAAEDYQAQVIISQQFNKQAEDVRSQLATAQATIGTIENELETAKGQLAERDAELAAVAADREELAQLKKEAKEAAAEIHREGRSIELEKAQWQQQLSDARADLADAQATILNQGNKIRELERGYSLKPNPAESALRLEIGNLREELEAYQQQQPPIDLSEQIPEIVNFLKKLLPPDTKWPKRVMPKLKEYLESKEEKNNEPD
jgi:chromosome segregation ATPase